MTSALDALLAQATQAPQSGGSSPLATLQLLTQLGALRSGGRGGGGSSLPAGGGGGGLSPAIGGSLQQWIDRAEQITGVNSPSMDNMLRILISHESGGSPTIVNKTPTPKGYHATGLAQMIQPTFDAYNLPKLGGITNPVANLVAAIRYMVDRYGSVAQTPGIASVLAGQGYQPY